jgi:DMSO/TMAO reductase YedYZ molybdopterin-dependent catalytic subunit
VNRRRIGRGVLAGFAAGAVTVLAMYAGAGLVGFQPLPEVLQQPILAVMPGPVFGFLIDNLQHLGKVVEEAGLVLTLVLALAGLGAVYAWLSARIGFRQLPLLLGLAIWLVVVLVLLPVGGAGFLGLRTGLATPIAWALLAAVYAVLLQLVFERMLDPQRAGAEEADPGRRRVLALLPWGIGLASLGALGLRLVPGWYQAVAHPPEAGVRGISPELTPVANFYLVSKNFGDPEVDAAGWSLNVRGLVGKPLRLDYQALRALPSTKETVTLECISNDVGGELMSTGIFTGIALRDLVTMAAPAAGATAVSFKARDGFTESLPLQQAMGAPEILVAWELDGAPLPSRHGFPARILIPGRYGMKGPKWLDEIQLTASDTGGYWEGQGWDSQAVVKTTARFDVPREGFILRTGAVELGGVAFAGNRGIDGVEYSVDAGRSWTRAEVKPPLSPYTWVLWHATWNVAEEGTYTLKVRARDGSGALQSARETPSFPSGASGYHTIRVNVAR